LKNRSIGVQFAKDGPFIPTELLHALEKGDLVVFCGAGISRYLGLPDFKGLVARVCEVLNRPLQPDEEQIQESGAFDLALGLIENRIGKTLLRSAVRRVLDVNKDGDLSTHKALLQLATTKRGQNHLVTTNFDRAFEFAQSGSCVFDYAPYLPTPATTWSSVVHLHGGLGELVRQFE
jgi:NAD-dependent SIR2 family protein deacetylase